MYILVRIGFNDTRSNEKVSIKKSALEKTLKEEGYYWSRKASRYIDDKNCGIEGGSGVDYIIEKCEEIK
jgi:hypothetical protein